MYDGFGWRMSKKISGTTTQNLYDRLNPVQELNGSNGVVANLLTGLRIDEYFTRTDTATSTFLADALGSTVGPSVLAGRWRPATPTNPLAAPPPAAPPATIGTGRFRYASTRQFVPVHRP